MSDLLLIPAANEGGVIDKLSKRVQGAPADTDQPALSLYGRDTEFWDYEVQTQDADGDWQPAASTVGLGAGTATPATGGSSPGPAPAPGPTYTAGAGIDITGGVISATLDTYTKLVADARFGRLAFPNTWQDAHTFQRYADFTSSYLPGKVQVSAFGIAITLGTTGANVDATGIQFNDTSNGQNKGGRLSVDAGVLKLKGDVATEVVAEPTTAMGIVNKAFLEKKIADAKLGGAPGDGGGPTYTAGQGIDLTDNVISAPGKADLVDETVPLEQLPAQLGPLSYPVMVNMRSAGFVGYESLEAAVQAPGTAYRTIVLNASILTISQDITITGSLYSQSLVQIQLVEGVTVTLTTGMKLQNIQFLRVNSSASKVVIASTQGPTIPLNQQQGIQLVNSRIGPDIYFTALGHVVTLLGRSDIDSAKGTDGTIYLYDNSAANVEAAWPTIVDLRPVPDLLVNGKLNFKYLEVLSDSELGTLAARLKPVLDAMNGGSNAAPQATMQAISGTPRQGSLLTLRYSYFDPENDPEIGTTYRWFRADDATGLNRVAINGAVQRTYTPTADDVTKYLQGGVLVRASSGAPEGVEVFSPYTTAVTPAPVSGAYTPITVFPYTSGEFTLTDNDVEFVPGASFAALVPVLHLNPGDSGAFRARSEGGVIGLSNDPTYAGSFNEMQHTIQRGSYGRITCHTQAGNVYVSDNVSTPEGTLVQLRTDATTVYYEYTVDGGATWTLVTTQPWSTPLTPKVVLYGGGGEAVYEMEQFGFSQ